MDLTRPIESAWRLDPDRGTATLASAVRHAGINEAPLDSRHDESLKLVHHIFLLHGQEPPRTVVFAGIDHGNGCSRVCAGIAETLAKVSGKTVCLVEANFRSPALAAMFRVTDHQGFSDALMMKDPIRSFAKPVWNDKLWLLSSGSRSNDSRDLLSSDQLTPRLTELREEFDFVIIDAPPLAAYAEATSLAQLSDGLIVVIEADSTRKQSALVAATNLRSSNVPILGAVLNKRKFPIPDRIYSRL